MHLTHTQLQLLAALLGGINKKPGLAVLSHLFFTPAGDNLILTASDLDLDFFWPLPVSKSPGLHSSTSLTMPVSCPIAWFLKIARGVPKGGHLEVRAEGPTVHLLPSKGPSVRSPERSIKIQEAPPFSTTGLTRGGWISTSTTAAMVKALPFTSTDETRYVLNGVLLQKDGHIVATDGRRLAHSPTPDTLLPQDIIVPTRFVAPLAALTAATSTRTNVWLNGSGETNGFGAQDANLMLIQCGACLARMKLIEGLYPNWRQVVPQDFSTLVMLREDFMADYTALLRTSTKRSETHIKLTLLPGRRVEALLYVNNGDPLGPPLHAGTHASRETYAMAFNAEFFRGTVDFSGPTLRLIDAISPATGGSPDGAQTVLMPMRVNA